MLISFKKLRFNVGAVLSASLLLLIGSQATAVEANYGDLEADSVTYRNVMQSGDALLHQPAISGDALSFQPLFSEFKAFSFGGDDDDVTNFLTTILVAKPGSVLDHITVTTSGSLDLFRLNKEATSATSVRTVIGITATIIDYIDASGVTQYGANIALSPQVATVSETQYAGAELRDASWNGATTLDFAAQAATEAGISGEMLRVGITVNTRLDAFSESVGTQSINRLGNFDALTLTIAPEPTSAALLLVSAVACCARRRRGA